jgi:hypothetical protein
VCATNKILKDWLATATQEFQTNLMPRKNPMPQENSNDPGKIQCPRKIPMLQEKSTNPKHPNPTQEIQKNPMAQGAQIYSYGEIASSVSRDCQQLCLKRLWVF